MYRTSTLDPAKQTPTLTNQAPEKKTRKRAKTKMPKSI